MAADSKSSPTRPPAPPAPVSFLKGNIVTKISGTGKGVSGIVVEVDANNRKIVMQTTDGQRFTSQSANNFALVGTAESTSAIIEANMPAPLSSPVGALEKQLADMTIERDEAIAQRDDFSARLDAAENKLHAVMGALNTPTKAAAESPTKNNSSKDSDSEHEDDGSEEVYYYSLMSKITLLVLALSLLYPLILPYPA